MSRDGSHGTNAYLLSVFDCWYVWYFMRSLFKFQHKKYYPNSVNIYYIYGLWIAFFSFTNWNELFKHKISVLPKVKIYRRNRTQKKYIFYSPHHVGHQVFSWFQEIIDSVHELLHVFTAVWCTSNSRLHSLCTVLPYIYRRLNAIVSQLRFWPFWVIYTRRLHIWCQFFW